MSFFFTLVSNSAFAERNLNVFQQAS